MLPRSMPSEYGWNVGAARYVELATGRFVSRATVALELEKIIEASQMDIIAAARSLVSGEITLSEWQLIMERSIKSLHTISAALAVGGWNQMNESDWGGVGSLIKKQYQWLDNFSYDIYTGKQSAGSIERRAKLYAQSGRGTYEEMRRSLAEDQGFTLEKRVLAPAEHCADCVMEAAKGWQPIGTLRPIGDSQCRTNCLCRFLFRK